MINQHSLPPDDLPFPISLDWELGRELDEMASLYFFDNCDRVTQQVLSKCGWYLSSFVGVFTLVIICCDGVTNWLVLKQLSPLANTLNKWLKTARIRIYPPPGEGTVMDVSVEEIMMINPISSS